MGSHAEGAGASYSALVRNGFPGLDDGSEDGATRAMKNKSRASKPGHNRHVGEEPARLIAELNPGKKGGDYPLPFGGHIFIPQGLLGKKDVVTCCMVSPSDRFKYQPLLRSDEHLLSEIFLIAMSCKSIKKGPPISLQLPYYREKTALFSSQMLFKRADEDEWSVHECSYDIENDLAEVKVDCAGIFVVTSVTKLERFEVPVHGCLYNAKIHHQISVRFPKKTMDADIQCDLSIIPLNRAIMDKLQAEYPFDMGELLAASDFYEVRPHVQKVYRRSVTVKLPLPQMPTEDFPHEDVAIMQMTPSDGWQLNDVPLKFIKNSVSFDTRNLGKYCVVLAKHDRKKRLKDAFRHIERENGMVRGEIIPFLHIQEKVWTLWFDVIPLTKVGAVMDRRFQQGFKRVKKMQLPMIQDTQEDEKSPKKSWRSAKSKQPEAEKKPEREDLDLVNGSCFEVDIGGDVKVCADDMGGSNLELRFHDRLPENYRRFFIEPLPMAEGRILTGFLKCYARGPDGERTCIRTFDFDVQPEAVGAYLAVDLEPEPEPEEPDPVVEPEPEVVPETPPPPPPPQPKQASAPKQNATSFARLTKPTKPAKRLFKDPKVLTGRSLMSLAREVEQGLTLAIHLDISDSTITGMGFDALANGLSLVDITYRILLLWKRRTSRFKDKQVDLLIEAMQDMGRKDLADVITDRHRVNMEITPECFESQPAAAL